MKNTKTVTTKRGAIRAILNRDKAYRLSSYLRKVSKKMGRDYKMSDIVTALRHMAQEGQLYFKIVDSKVYGCLTFGPKAFQII